MEEKLSSYWEQSEEILDEDLILNYEEYQDFIYEQDDIYQSLYIEKIIKNDTIKFY